MLKTNFGRWQNWLKTPQEQRLAIGLLCCLSLFVGFRLVKASQGLWALQYSRINTLNTQIRDLQQDIESQRELTVNRLRNQAESLPADSTLAGTRYYTWLHELATKHGWQEIKIDSTSPVAESGLGDRLTISLQGRAAIEAVGALVDEFESCRLLHGMTRLQLTDISSTGRDGRVSLSIETLSLPDAASDLLLTVSPDQVERDGGLASTLSKHNPFRRYEPPKPVVVAPAVTAPIVDHLTKVKFVGVVQRDGVPQAWFFDGLNSDELLLAEGKPLTIDDFNGLLKSIGTDEVSINVQDRVITMRLGQDLRAAIQEGSSL